MLSNYSWQLFYSQTEPGFELLDNWPIRSKLTLRLARANGGINIVESLGSEHGCLTILRGVKSGIKFWKGQGSE